MHFIPTVRLNVKVVMITNTWFLRCVAILMLFTLTMTDDPNPPVCEIFCQGKILEVVQNSKIYPDSKTFVDMKMKLPKTEILALFNDMMTETNGKPHKLRVRRFVRRCFTQGHEFERHQPTDWKENPKFLANIKDESLKQWAEELNKMWKRLGRRVSRDVRKNPNMYSMIYVPNTLVVANGKHKEYYYWEVYWITLGLINSEMYQTVKGMITNCLILVEKYGYIPNGGRVYYLSRSNMPLLIPTVKNYYSATRDLEFIKKNIGTLEKEFNFWIQNRVVEVTIDEKSFKAARYGSAWNDPRPDAYSKDVETAKSITTQKGKQEYYNNLISACESGWSFSSRWFRNDSKTDGNITHTITNSILPVDLNAVLCLNARILSMFYKTLNVPAKQLTYYRIYKQFQESLQGLMWNDDDGIWYDYDMLANSTRQSFYISNMFPLWTSCYRRKKTENDVGSKVTKYLKSLGIQNYKGGVPVSLIKTKQNWDFPNVIPRMQLVIIQGLYFTGDKEAIELAFQLAKIWLRSTYESYLVSQSMFSSYDAEKSGPNGERNYTAQTGYGSTNGICLELLSSYGKQIILNINSATSHIPSVVLQLSFVTLFVF